MGFQRRQYRERIEASSVPRRPIIPLPDLPGHAPPPEEPVVEPDDAPEPAEEPAVPGEAPAEPVPAAPAAS